MSQRTKWANYQTDLDLRIESVEWFNSVRTGQLTSLEKLYLSALSGPVAVEEKADLKGRVERNDSARVGQSHQLAGRADWLSATWAATEPSELSGTIPSELGNLTNLEGLALWGNELSGTIPSELGNLTNLEGLSLSDNELSGTIPPELGNLTNLEGLYLWGNELSGTIPSELGKLTNLTGLFSENELSGTIPSELGKLTNLKSWASQRTS